VSRNEPAQSNFFVLRSPLLPFDEFLRWSEGLDATACLEDEEALESALRRDRDRLRDRLRALVARPDVRDALFVASPELESGLASWERDPESQRARALERALVRYFARMAGRATPFGLFAGCSTGRIGKRTHLLLEAAERSERHSRLDHDYLDKLLSGLLDDPELRGRVLYRPNSSLYHAAGQVRYVEIGSEGRQRTHHLVAAEPSDHLERALVLAEAGITPRALAAALASNNVSVEEAENFVADLIESQVLLPDLAVPLTGPEPLEVLPEELERHAGARAAARSLARVRSDLAQLDADGLGAEPGRYRRIAAHLEGLPAEPEAGELFQVDLHKPAPAALLGEAVVQELLRGVEILRRMSAVRSDAQLQSFAERFAERFERREVPLVDALDDDVGVGFPEPDPLRAAPLLDGLPLRSSNRRAAMWGAREDLLLRHLAETIAAGRRSLKLGRDELAALEVADPPPLPGAFAVSAVVAARSDEALDRGDFRLLLEGCVGPSGARALGRFTHGDPELRAAVEAHLRAEEALDPEAIFAEIVHLPQGRHGNILSRRKLRPYEIEYLGRSSAPPDYRIPVTDLTVSLGGREDGVVLRSRRLGRRVRPRLTTAQNFHSFGISLYRFLCLLQADATAGNVAWQWGPLAAAPFLPRVETGRLVLSLARWRLSQPELGGLRARDDAARFRALQVLREHRGMPRLIGLADGDNVLPVDLDNVLSVESCLALLKTRDEAVFVELWPPPDELCARGPEGRYCHELVVPFVRSTPAKTVPGGRAAPAAEVPRTLPPGSEWLYGKLYCGGAVADRALRDVVSPLAAEVVGSGAADRWFFIRYADPHEHLRLRFHGEPDALREEVQPRLEGALARLIEDGWAWRLSFDTYEREIERYGGPEAIEHVERIFHADSDAVVELLAMFEPGEAGAEERWRMALCGTSMLLEDVGLDEEARLRLLEDLRARFAREFEADGDFTGALGERLRTYRKELEPLVVPGDDVPDELLPGVEALRVRSERMRAPLDELWALEAAGKLAVTRASLAASLVHMHLNRLVRSAPRAHELVLYDFLVRLYRSRLARRSPR
jgi:thiopeptide-type bacteriocin biosynthesis protein